MSFQRLIVSGIINQSASQCLGLLLIPMVTFGKCSHSVSLGQPLEHKGYSLLLFIIFLLSFF